MPNETTIEKKGNETDQEKLNIRRIISGAEVYYNFTGNAKCLDLGNEDKIGAGMWDYQVQVKYRMSLSSTSDRKYRIWTYLNTFFTHHRHVLKW